MGTRHRVGQNSQFGTTGEAKQWGGFDDRAPYHVSSTRTAEELESQNDEHLDGLTAKVKLLKEVTMAIGNEVRDSATQLSHMNDAFSETSGILAGTFHRMKRLSSRQGCRFLWFILFLVLVFWFFIVVWWFRR